MSPSHLLRAAFGLASIASVCSAGILTVGPAGSGAQFTEIQAAIDAALDDDVILVKPGTYARIIVERPLRILSDGTGTVRIQSPTTPPATIHGIAAAKELVISGVEASTAAGNSQLSPQMILVQDCPGTVVLQDLVIPQTFVVGVEAENCGRVLVLDCRIQAGFPSGEVFQRGAVFARNSELWAANSDVTGASFGGGTFAGVSHGFELVDSTLRLWRSRIRGGGPGSALKAGFAGGAGIRATRSVVDLFGGPTTTVDGGRGGIGLAVTDNAPGGPGLDLLDHSHARIQDDVPVQGGLDGEGLVRAPAVRVDGTSLVTFDPRVFPTLASSVAHAQMGTSFALTLSGTPGGFQILFLSLGTGPTMTLPGVDGFGMLDRPLLRRLVGETLPPASSQTVSLRVPATPALLGATLFFQAAERSASGFAISNPALVTITR